MKILWCVNQFPAEIALTLGLSAYYGGGWVGALRDQLIGNGVVSLTLATVYEGATVEKKRIQGVEYVLVPGGRAAKQRYNKAVQHGWRQIVNDIMPDVVHIHGTEYAHSLALVRSLGRIPCVVSLQGLLGECAKHYHGGIAWWRLLGTRTLRDNLMLDGVFEQQRKMQKRAKYEVSLLNEVQHIIGRTTWDYAVTKAINSKLNYHIGQELLRDPFYAGAWDVTTIERHSIYASQAVYPLKGLHFLIEAIAIVKRFCPHVKLYVGGPDTVNPGSKYGISRQSGYGRYLRETITRLELRDNIVFTGPLSAQAVKERLLKSHVFCSPSLIENSPNSLAEAMMLGVPVIATYVGGVPDMVRHGESGFLVPPADPLLLAEYILHVFDSSTMASTLGRIAQEVAMQRHDRNLVLGQTIDTYRKIIDSKGER